MSFCFLYFVLNTSFFIIFFNVPFVYALLLKFPLFFLRSPKRFIKERKERTPDVEVAVATKFAALPWRLGRESVLAALKDSLSRLELSSVELYQLHW